MKNINFIYIFLIIFILSGCGFRPKKSISPRYIAYNQMQTNYRAVPLTSERYPNKIYIKESNRPYIITNYTTPINREKPAVNQLQYTQKIFLSIINSVRREGGVCMGPSMPLMYDQQLESAAQSHANDMAYNHFLSHQGSDGSNFVQRVQRYGYQIDGNIVGEVITFTKLNISNTNDIFLNFQRSIENFLSSPNHCRVLMNPRFRKVGVGYRDTQNGYYWVLEFGGR